MNTCCGSAALNDLEEDGSEELDQFIGGRRVVHTTYLSKSLNEKLGRNSREAALTRDTKRLRIPYPWVCISQTRISHRQPRVKRRPCEEIRPRNPL